MTALSYQQRRTQLETYFDRTAVDAWARLTSDAPVSGIRATVRAGRETMRNALLGWLPQDLRGKRLLDAGCGTGALVYEAARRGAEVIAIDLSPTLIGLASERAPAHAGGGSVSFHVGDMVDPALGVFDHIVAMDSLIHYRTPDMVRALTALTVRTRVSLLFTFAPRTPMLATMHAVGRLFPRGDRAPAIEPVGQGAMATAQRRVPEMAVWRQARMQRVTTTFYMSHAVELVRA